jgi:membrane fusion protein (multidrug efflux system)
VSRRAWIASIVLLAAVIATGSGLFAWKYARIQQAIAASANQPEPMERVRMAVAEQRWHQRKTTVIGTMVALRSVTLKNELPGTVRQVMLTAGQVVEPGTVLVALDVAVEEAELKSQQAEVMLAETAFRRAESLHAKRWIPDADLDRARAERDVALAQIARIKAIIERKTIRAPFRARVGISDVHPGQYLEEGTPLTTLQGIDSAAHVDFAVEQRLASGLRVGETVDVSAQAGDGAPIAAPIVAIDARVDPATRNALVRARIDDAAAAPPPGAAVRVQVPMGPRQPAVAVPASALRKGPSGDHVFVLSRDDQGRMLARLRKVAVAELLGDEVVIREGLAAGEQVAASGSFKLRDQALVSLDTTNESGGRTVR